MVVNPLHPGDAGDGPQLLLGGRVVEPQDEGIRLDVIVELLDTAGEDELPVLNHLDVVAHGLHLREDMGGEQYGMVRGNLLDKLPHLENLVGVEAVGRLVEDDELRPVHDGLGDTEALLVTAGQVADEPLAEVGDAATLLHLLHGGADKAGRHGPQLGAVHEVLVHGVVRVQGRFLRQEADILAGLDGLAAGVMPVDVHGALRLIEHAADDVHRGRLAGAVGAEEPHDALLINLEIDIAYGPIHGVAVGQMFYFQYRCLHNCPMVLFRFHLQKLYFH